MDSRIPEEADRRPPTGHPARRLALACALLATAVGCVGPRGLELTRLRYDQAIHETSDQQWLRNIVRLRYGERPTFLDVAAVNSQLELTTRGSIVGGQERDSANRSLFGDLSLQFRDAPTLSYTPRPDTELTRAIVAPVGVTALGLLATTGWSNEDVLRLMVSEANGLANAPGADELIPCRAPELTPFAEVARLAGRLKAAGAGRLAVVEQTRTVAGPIGVDRVDGADLVSAATNKLAFRPADPGRLVLTEDDPVNVFLIRPEAAADPEVEALRGLLRLAPGRLEYPVRRAERTAGDPLRPLADAEESITVRTRTVLEMMIFLSKGVEVPEAHVLSGVAMQTPAPDGPPFDWTLVTRGLFHVCVAKKRPGHGPLAVEYRGHWYWIDDRDQRSKSTLAMIQALLNLQLNEPKSAGPVLTLPVGL